MIPEPDNEFRPVLSMRVVLFGLISFCIVYLILTKIVFIDVARESEFAKIMVEFSAVPISAICALIVYKIWAPINKILK